MPKFRRVISIFTLVFAAGALITMAFPPKAFALYNCLTGGDHAGAAWDPATDCPGGVAGAHTNIGAMTINTGETATVQTYNGSIYGSVQISAASITITGTLTADSQGYAAMTGPGVPAGTTGGAGYGGAGGAGSSAGGAAYGSYTAPTSLGSGAVTAGGGAIQLTATGTTTINGTLTANGGNISAGGCAGAGSGGSIYITTATFAGSGTVTANGGNGFNCASGSSFGGNGGGGRIAMYYSSANTFSGAAPTVNAGTTGNGGLPGTAIIVDSTNNDLYVTTSQTWNANPSFEGGTVSYRNVTVSNNAVWTMVGYNTTSSNGVGITFKGVNFTVNTGSKINLDSQGYAAMTGPGVPAGSTGGAGYGGAGGAGSSAGGAAYGSYAAPTDLGSGAVTAGGGAIKLTATGTTTINGSLTANGGNITSGGCAGAGSGGSIYITTGTFTGSGTVTANGGNGFNCAGGTSFGGNGGGGRIAIYFSSSLLWTGTTLDATHAALKGSTGNGGANGTVLAVRYSYATTRSMTMVSSAPSATANSYTVVFTPGTSTTVGGIVVDICDNDPLVGDVSCTYPAGFDWGGASPTLVVNSGMGSGWTATGVQGGAASGKSQVLELSNTTPQSLSTSTPISFTITSVTNPSTANHSYYARIVTFTDASSMTSQYTVSTTVRGGSFFNRIDFGSMAVSTSNGINISFIVAESLVFCVSATAIGSNCSGTTTPNIALGHSIGGVPVVSSTQVDKTNVYVQSSVNARSGITVRMAKTNRASLGVSSTRYLVPITIDNTSNTNTLTNYQVLITVDTATAITAGKMRSDCADARFADTDQVTLLTFWLASGCNTATTKFWVKVPSISASSSKIIYLLYGNAALASASNGSNTFIYYDDFATNTTGNYTSQGGAVIAYDGTNKLMQQTDTTSTQHWIVGTTDSLPSAYVYEADVRVDSDPSARKHAGLVTDFLTGAVTGYRLTHLDGNFIVSKWLNGAETAINNFPDGGIYSGGAYLTERAYRDRTSGLIKYEITNGTTTVSQSNTDTTYTAGHIGFHSYGNSTSMTNIHVRSFSSPEPTTSTGSETALGCSGLSIGGGVPCGIPAVNTTCSGSCTATTITAGTPAVGMCVSPGTVKITATPPYNGANCSTTGTTFGFDDASATNLQSQYGSQIFSSTGPLNQENDVLTFAATVSSTTPAGLYSGSYELIIAGSF